MCFLVQVALEQCSLYETHIVCHCDPQHYYFYAGNGGVFALKLFVYVPEICVLALCPLKLAALCKKQLFSGLVALETICFMQEHITFLPGGPRHYRY